MLPPRGFPPFYCNVCFRTPLHLSIEHDNRAVFDLLLEVGASTEVKSSEGFPPLWNALKDLEEKKDGSKYAERLVSRKAAVSVVSVEKGNLK